MHRDTVMLRQTLYFRSIPVCFCTESDKANQLQIISGSAPAVQPTNRGRAESRDVDTKWRI